MKSFRKIKVQSYELSKVQDAVSDYIQQLQRSNIIDGVLLKDVALTNSDAVISHKLDRVPQGYIVVDVNKNATIFRSAWDSRTITLQSSAATTTCSLWIF